MSMTTQRPSPHTTSLETFDPLELLFMLGRSGRSGVLRVVHRQGDLLVSLLGGRVTEARLGTVEGPAALAVVAGDPRGHFAFEDGLPPRGPFDLTVEALAVAALRDLPPPAPLFDGPGKLAENVSESELGLTETERRLLALLISGTPLGQLTDPQAVALAGRLSRLGLLVPRKARIARLTLGLDRGQARAATLDEMILMRWREDTGEAVRQVAVKTEVGRVLNFAVRAGSGLGNTLVLPREWLMQHGLRSGESVLVRPS